MDFAIISVSLLGVFFTASSRTIIKKKLNVHNLSVIFYLMKKNAWYYEWYIGITFRNSLFLFMNCLAVHLAYTAPTILYSCKFLDTNN